MRWLHTKKLEVGKVWRTLSQKLTHYYTSLLLRYFDSLRSHFLESDIEESPNRMFLN